MRDENIKFVRQEPEVLLAIADKRIEWVLNNPHMSSWIKMVVKSTIDRDPIALQNDLEVLSHLIRARTQAQIAMTIDKGKTPNLDE